MPSFGPPILLAGLCVLAWLAVWQGERDGGNSMTSNWDDDPAQWLALERAAQLRLRVGSQHAFTLVQRAGRWQPDDHAAASHRRDNAAHKGASGGPGVRCQAPIDALLATLAWSRARVRLQGLSLTHRRRFALVGPRALQLHTHGLSPPRWLVLGRRHATGTQVYAQSSAMPADNAALLPWELARALRRVQRCLAQRQH
ncbi:MAG: hypothetical protein ACPGUV_11945 [Polyangiales bacterium]